MLGVAGEFLDRSVEESLGVGSCVFGVGSVASAVFAVHGIGAFGDGLEHAVDGFVVAFDDESGEAVGGAVFAGFASSSLLFVAGVEQPFERGVRGCGVVARGHEQQQPSHGV